MQVTYGSLKQMLLTEDLKMANEKLCEAACPIARSLGRIGDGWSILILRDSLSGLTRFDEFQRSCNIATNILSQRLKNLVDNGFLEKVCYNKKPPRYEYYPTEMTKKFRVVLIAMAEWGSYYFSPEGKQIQLVEKKTQRLINPILVDKETGKEITSEDYETIIGPAASPDIKYIFQYIAKKNSLGITEKFLPPSSRINPVSDSH